LDEVFVITHKAPTDELAVLVRFLKSLFIAMLGSVLLFWVLLGVLSSPGGPRQVGPVKPALAFVALGLALATLYLRYGRIAPLLSPLRPASPTESIPQLRLYYLLCYVFAADVALMGFILGILGVERADVFPFFLAAATLFALCYPRVPAGR
jgi:hypothetical protein